MKTLFTRRFSKDLGSILTSSVLQDILRTIEDVEKATFPSDIKNLKKLKGFANAYRIRTGDHRIGIFIENNVVTFVRIAHRKDIYKIFP